MFYYDGKPIKRVGFLGVGKSNLGIYSYLLRRFPDISYTVRGKSSADSKRIPAQRYFFGDEAFSELDEDILFLSPSARRDAPELISAKERGVILSSDCELFFKCSQSEIFAVTGSDGKSTTAYITSELLKRSGYSSLPFGNFGEAMTPHLDDGADILYVAELSSFQLMYETPKTRAAAITNITENHLNWHKGFDEYISAKRNVLENTKRRIFNFDCEISRKIMRDFQPYAVYSRFLSQAELEKKVEAELYLTLSDGIVCVSGEKLLDTQDVLIPGEHNISNYMCAIALCCDKLDRKALAPFAREFGGLAHRREFVGRFEGVDYYNSSIDSSPQRCISTLKTFDKNVILIVGGRTKGLDFSPILPYLKEKTKLVIATGESAFLLEELCFSHEVNTKRIDDFEAAVLYAKKTAQAGDTVLLSPAATSYDCFKNFEERGRFFKELIKPKGK